MYFLLVFSIIVNIILFFDKRLDRSVRLLLNLCILVVSGLILVTLVYREFIIVDSVIQNPRQLKVKSYLRSHLDCFVITKTKEGREIATRNAIRNEAETVFKFRTPVNGEILFSCRERGEKKNLIYLQNIKLGTEKTTDWYLKEINVNTELISVFKDTFRSNFISRFIMHTVLALLAIAIIRNVLHLFKKYEEHTMLL
ncbi:MAG: hypothetical protein HQK83_02260 [Fibrobacteria bacterium]|nr:hypothetical protein [Fibrobacteria bacterium]